MNRFSLPILAFGLCAAVGVSGVASADSITVPNFSFESPVVGDGGAAAAPIPNWDSSGTVSTINPNNITFFNATDTSATSGVPTGGDGRQSAELDGVSSIQSATGVATVQSQTAYGLTVAIGNFRTNNPGMGRIGFLVNNALVTTSGSQSYMDFDFSTLTVDGQFKDFTFNYTPQNVDGATLKIFFGELSGTAVAIDNVRLVSSAAVVTPEPSTWAMMLMGMVGPRVVAPQKVGLVA